MSATYERGKFIDYYEMLGVEYDAPVRMVRAAYIRLAKSHHPDAGGTTTQMQLLNHAYKTLTVLHAREAYNKIYRLHNAVDEDLELREDYKSQPKAHKITADEYADFFVDSLYAEYCAVPQARKPSFTTGTIIAYTLMGLAVIVGILMLAGVL